MAEELTMSILDHVIHAADFFAAALGDEVAITVCDRERFVYLRPGRNLSLPFQTGDPLLPGGMDREIVDTGQKIVRHNDLGIGISYTAVGIPVRDPASGKVLGALVINTPTVRDDLLATASQLAGTAGTVAGNIDDLSAAVQEIAALMQQLAEDARNIQENVKQSDSLLELVRHIADQTHLLGLNAAIEAARAGSHGGGFGVVAAEIRKLAARTNKSVADIAATLKTIQGVMAEFSGKIANASRSTEQQAAAVQEVAAAMHQLEATAAALGKLADQLHNE